MTYTTPCADPANDPEDWFIGRDGKQYADDDFLTDEETSNVSKAVLRKEGETAEEHRDRVDAAIGAAERDRKRKALQARRHAKEACGECYLRLACLDKALEDATPANHGTWGGYFEEELREIRRAKARRSKRS